MKKDYDGPLYAPWYKVVEGKKHNKEWLERHGISSIPFRRIQYG